MPCQEFERQLTEYATLVDSARARADVHLSHCASCRECLRLLNEIDAGLSATYGDVRAPATLVPGIHRGLVRAGRERLSALPEVLDYMAWCGVIGAGAALAWFSDFPLPEFSGPVLYVTAAILLLVAAGVSFWVTRSSEY